MKSAIYIEEGVMQFVLTPESEIDKKVLSQIEKAKGLTTYRGSFYACQGGWIRQAATFEYGYRSEHSDNSLIFTIREEKDLK